MVSLTLSKLTRLWPILCTPTIVGTPRLSAFSHLARHSLARAHAARTGRSPRAATPATHAASVARVFAFARASSRARAATSLPPRGSPRDEDSCPRVAPRGAEAAPAGARARREARAAACRDDEEEDQGRGVPDEGGRPSQVRPRRAFRPRRAAIFSNSPSRLPERSPAASARNLTPRVPAGFFFFFFRRYSTRRATG